MKSTIDFCKIQWFNREFLPKNYAFKWNGNESRFNSFFQKLFWEEKDSESTSSSDDSLSSKPYSYYSKYPILQNFIKDNTNTKPKCQRHRTIKYKSRSIEIDITKILTQEDKRMTLMIKNIPNKFTKEYFISILNQKFRGKFNLLLLPTDYQNKKNYGYAFINFINYLDIIYFYELFNGKKWEKTNSLKICEIVYSKIQGVSKMIKHYSNNNIFLNEERSSGIKDDKGEQLDNIIVIPLKYQEIFRTLYPRASLEFNIRGEEIFYVKRSIFVKSKKGTS